MMKTTMNLRDNKSIAIVLIVLTTTTTALTRVSFAESWFPARRQNGMEPLYDDSEDIHTVSASPNIRTTTSLGEQSPQKSTTSPFQLPTLQQQNINNQATADSLSILRPRYSTKGATVEPHFSGIGNINTKTSVTPLVKINRIGSTITASVNQLQLDRNKDIQHHWSALENYYQRLKPSIYRINPSNDNDQTNHHQIYHYFPYDFDDKDPSPFAQPSTKLSPFAFNNDQQQSNQFLNRNPNSANTKNPSTFIQPPINFSNQSTVSKQGAAKQAFYQHIGPVGRTDQINNPSFILELDPEILQPSTKDGSAGLSSVNPNQKIKYIEWRKLPELLLIQQQQQRAKYQQATLGSWYDHEQIKEILQEEAFCGPRNYVKLQVLSDQQQLPSAAISDHNRQFDQPVQQIQYDKLLSEGYGTVNVQVALSSGEYPSHIGLYEQSAQNNDNFLCGASWIRDSFALTLASCVSGLDQTRLVARIGEWNLDKVPSDDRPLVTIGVKRIHIFPKYNLNNSHEHNLALVEFEKPIEYLQMPYVSPACQLKARSPASALSSCWTPVRNRTTLEYFDATEGETREKKTTSMIEMPVRLIMHDDSQCFRKAGIKMFNYNYPNYICSGDYRTALWRAKLNETSYYGSGIYCNDNGNLNLISMIHPIYDNDPSAIGFIDLKFYEPWMKNKMRGLAVN